MGIYGYFLNSYRCPIIKFVIAHPFLIVIPTIGEIFCYMLANTPRGGRGGIVGIFYYLLKSHYQICNSCSFCLVIPTRVRFCYMLAITTEDRGVFVGIFQ